MGPDVMVRQDVDECGALHPVGMVEAHARHGAGAAVVSGGEEFAVAEPLHDLDLVLRHRPERVIDVVGAGLLRPEPVPVPTRTSGDDMKALGATPGALVP